MPLKVGINGFGRIGRLVFRAGVSNPNIEFVGRVSNEELRQLYSEARAFIFSAEEDAGIMPLEAMACGTPVIAYGKGGALETVIENHTGEFFYEQTAEAVADKVKNFDAAKYESKNLVDHAKKFDKKIFKQKIKDFVEEKYAHRT